MSGFLRVAKKARLSTLCCAGRGKNAEIVSFNTIGSHRIFASLSALDSVVSTGQRNTTDSRLATYRRWRKSNFTAKVTMIITFKENVQVAKKTATFVLFDPEKWKQTWCWHSPCELSNTDLYKLLNDSLKSWKDAFCSTKDGCCVAGCNEKDWWTLMVLTSSSPIGGQILHEMWRPKRFTCCMWLVAVTVCDAMLLTDPARLCSGLYGEAWRRKNNKTVFLCCSGLGRDTGDLFVAGANLLCLPQCTVLHLKAPLFILSPNEQHCHSHEVSLHHTLEYH